VNILFDNVSWNSNAGPHWFARKLAETLKNKGHITNSLPEDSHVQLSLVIAGQRYQWLPIIQRLDGIYYDTQKNYKVMNEPIHATYNMASGVVFQSEWSKKLVESFFGPAEKYAIIHNGADVDSIQNTAPATGLEKYDKVWSCASSWFYEDGTQRYIKRLGENIRYFQEHSGDNDILCVAGDVKDFVNPDPSKIMFLGELQIGQLYSLYRATDNFIHLGRFDNCPNVVVDARAAGCHIICSSLGGTVEVAGSDSTVIVEDDWDFVPFKCNVESTLDFSQVDLSPSKGKDISMDHVADKYLNFLKGIHNG